MTDTANLGLPFIEAAQAQKHVTHNEALRVLDTLVQLTVLDRDVAASPGSPAEGQRWIVAASPTDAWAGHADDVAAWQDGSWQFSTPQTGWVAFVADEGTLLVWNGLAWGDFFSTVTSIQNLALLGLGTTADATNPFSAKLNKALWTAKTVAEGGVGDLRYTLNKESAGNVLSLLLQTAFSGRAELGLIGDDNVTLKVSADGSAWTTALIVDKATGLLTHADGTIPRTLSVQNGGDTNSSAAGSGADYDHSLTYTAPANFLKQARAIRVTAHFRFTTGGTAPNLTLKLKAGTTELVSAGPMVCSASQTNDQFAVAFILQALDAPGSAANVEAAVLGSTNGVNNTVSSKTDMPVTVATNAPVQFKIATMWSSAGVGTNTIALSQFIVEALN
jgi:hypothetical protein